MRRKITVLWFVTAYPCIFRGMPCVRPRDLRDQSLLQFTTLRIGRAAELAMSATAFLLATRASPWLGVSLGTEVAR